jgi:hypothetical protein
MTKSLKLILCAGMITIASDALAVDGACPAETKLETLNAWDEFKNTGPYDAASVTTATAYFHKDMRTHIVLTNAEVKAQEVAADPTKSIVKGAGKLALDLVLSNSRKPLVPGEYSPKNRFGEMGVKTNLMLGSSEKAASGLSAKDGTVEVKEVTAERVCGTFDLKTPYGPVKGEFVAPIQNVQ